MSTVTLTALRASDVPFKAIKTKRVESIDLLRGFVMIIMALDHVRHFFHRDSFLYEPTNLDKTTVFLFFTRFITHYCAPVFVFLAGASAYLSGIKKTKRELSRYLFTRGLWLVFVELFIIGLGQTFNPSYPIFNLQVIWAIGISMIVLSALIYLKRQIVLAIALVLIGAHNLLDNVHVQGTGPAAFFWAFLHEPKEFIVGHSIVYVMYPVLPWIGIISLGYCMGSLYHSNYDAEKRRKTLFTIGISALILFLILRSSNIYGDAAHWSVQKNMSFSILSILNVTKYPPSLLYTLITLGPAMVFLALSEKPLNAFKNKVAVFGRTPFFYYVLHIYVIHLLAMIGAVILGYHWSDMILTNKLNRVGTLKGYGFDLLTTYIVWIALIIFLYPFCRWFDKYKRANQAKQWWLTYL